MINNIDNLNLGQFLQIIFTDGYRNQISEEYREWDMVQQMREGNSLAREIRFLFQSSLGPSAVQYRDPGTSSRSFPASQQISIAEHSAKFNEINATIEIEYQMWDRARKSPEKYAEPLAAEIESKAISSRRRIAADFYGDGTGVIGTLGASAGTLVGQDVEFQLATGNADRGHVGFFEYGDILVARELDGTASTLDLDSSSPVYWQVKSKDRENAKVTLTPLDANLAPTTGNSSLTNNTAGEVFYRYGQPTLDADLTSISADYSTLTEVIAGLESLTANDGRNIHGITMSGSTAGTRLNANGDPIDVKHIERVMNDAKIAVGEGKYVWKMAMVAPETHSAFVEGRETDRRFHTLQDDTRGLTQFAYQHRKDRIALEASEYVPQNRMYIMPEARQGSKVLEYHGTDFETVKGQGMGDFHLKPASGGGHVNNIVSYLTAYGVLVCKHPAAIAVIENFSND